MANKDYETKRGRQPQEMGDIEEKHPNSNKKADPAMMKDAMKRRMSRGGM